MVNESAVIPPILASDFNRMIPLIVGFAALICLPGILSCVITQRRKQRHVPAAGMGLISIILGAYIITRGLPEDPQILFIGTPAIVIGVAGIILWVKAPRE